jgi:hypothetical protein
LFTIDVQNGNFTDNSIDVAGLIDILAPLLAPQDRIMRLKHPVVHSTLHNLVNQNKVSIPLKESEKDLLLRGLTYAKLTLRDKAEPTLNNLDPSLQDRLFHQHKLLEYAVRYWPLHLNQSPLAPNSGEFKPNTELQKAFPATVLLPILEQISWDTRLPTPQALELHTLAAKVRRGIFSENHAAVLQTYLAIATNHLLMGKPAESSKYFYLSSRISRTVLGNSHPLTIQCANRFISVTDSMTTTTRTEIMTHREEILTLLIVAYEGQLGSNSEMVIQVRKLLADLYISINEPDKAREINRLVQEQYGILSHQAHDMQNHLNVVLGGGKEDHTIDAYKESIFHYEGEEAQDVVKIRDIVSIDAYLRTAEGYASKKEYSMAEQSYVELWREVSWTCRTVQSIEMHEKNIEIATAYSRFLRSQKRTSESSSILAAIWQQYEHHQLSYSEQIVRQLINVAKEMKIIEMFTSAFWIFKFASAFYKHVQQEDTAISQEVENELSELSAHVTQPDIPSNGTPSSMHDEFLSIVQSSQTVDSKIMSQSIQRSSQYIERKEYSAAITVIQATLQRTWASFLSNSIKDIKITSMFTRESIELVERLAECYLQTKQMEKAVDIYSRFFHAALATQNVDQTILERAKALLLNYYDKHRYADNAIAVLQDILVTYGIRYGYSHELTIHVLYDLGRRCQAHPRTHPYWVEYYLQIITNLNKGSDTCHKDALNAIIVVTDTYWEDRRFAEAVTLYRVLWNTFIKQTKQHKIFSDTQFVRRLYEHYHQCLQETTASYESLFQVAKQYQETCIATFGAKSSITIDATLSFAQVAQQSTEHASTAISLYQELSQLSQTTTISISTSEINQMISSLYSQSQPSSNLGKDTLSHAISMLEVRLRETREKYGYSHATSLALLKELSLLYHRQQKTDFALKQLTTAVAVIVSKEESSEQMIEAGAVIASTFHALQQTNTGNSLVQELHRQICAKENRYASKWSFDLTKSGRLALAFLASFQYNFRKDLSITFAEIMADLTMEYLYFERFRKTLGDNENLETVLLAAASLRWFLRQNDQHEMIAVVEDQAVALFTKRDPPSRNMLTKEAPHLFIVGILDRLGNGRNRNFNRSVMASSNETVGKLTKSKKFLEAYDVANLSFLYASRHDMYNEPQAISMGFQLASLLAGRDSSKCPDAELRKKMLDLSNCIIHKILDTCEQSNINFAQVQLYELSQLSVLLAEQKDWSTLEVSSRRYSCKVVDSNLHAVAPQQALEYPRCSTLLASPSPPKPRPPPHLCSLPCGQSRGRNSSLRRHCIQSAPLPRPSCPRHHSHIRVARSAVHQRCEVIPSKGLFRKNRSARAGILQESSRGARGHPAPHGA